MDDFKYADATKETIEELKARRDQILKEIDLIIKKDEEILSTLLGEERANKLRRDREEYLRE